ncbi:MAG: hypothetical protein WCO10_01925 [bacterium]
MSESDIRSKCTEAQAKMVLYYLDKGWDVGELDTAQEVMLSSGSQRKWVKPCGTVYPN